MGETEKGDAVAFHKQSMSVVSLAFGILTENMIPCYANASLFHEKGKFKADQWCRPINEVPVDWLVEQKRC